MSKYTPIIGMEIHVQLKTQTKMFSSDPVLSHPDTPNQAVNEVTLGHPGTLPVPNKQAIAYNVMIGKALGCTIRDISKFDRKHYFYPDLPKGYQISQYDEPIAEYGEFIIDLRLEDNHRDHLTVHIRRAHLEEDTAKLTHGTDGSTLVDFNRAGTPLVEIVTEPDFQSAVEAKVFCQELRTLLRYLGVSDADMEKGQMRCEANISVQETGKFEITNGEVRPIGNYILNNKVELKNLNSFKAVEKGILFEIERQTALLAQEETWPQQTRGWDEQKGETVMQRLKENAADYRYFPEPDIPPFTPLTIAGDISIPELPLARRERFHREYGFSYADAKLLTDDVAWSHFAESVMTELFDWLSNYPELKDNAEDILADHQQKIARLAASWMTTKLLGALKERNQTIATLSISAENFAELISLIFSNRINATNAQKLLIDMLDAQTNIDPTHIMEEKGYGQVNDASAIETYVDQVITQFPSQVAEYKAGKEPLLKFLMGMVMKASEGTADPALVETMLKEKLS